MKNIILLLIYMHILSKSRVFVGNIGKSYSTFNTLPNSQLQRLVMAILPTENWHFKVFMWERYTFLKRSEIWALKMPFVHFSLESTIYGKITKTWFFMIFKTTCFPYSTFLKLTIHSRYKGVLDLNKTDFKILVLCSVCALFCLKIVHFWVMMKINGIHTLR